MCIVMTFNQIMRPQMRPPYFVQFMRMRNIVFLSNGRHQYLSLLPCHSSNKDLEQL